MRLHAFITIIISSRNYGDSRWAEDEVSSLLCLFVKLRMNAYYKIKLSMTF